MGPFPGFCRVREKMLWITTSAAGLLLPQDLPLCTARHRHKSPCVPWILLGLCRTSKAASRAWLRSGTQGQALSRRRLGGAKYRSNGRNRVCMGVQGAPRSGGQCRNRVRAGAAEAREDMFTLLVIHHFFLFNYRSNNPTIVQSTGRSTVPSAGFPMHGPSGLPRAPAVLLTLASSL